MSFITFLRKKKNIKNRSRVPNSNSFLLFTLQWDFCKAWIKLRGITHIYNFARHFSYWTLFKEHVKQSRHRILFLLQAEPGTFRKRVGCMLPIGKFLALILNPDRSAAYTHPQWQCTAIKANEGKLIHFSALSKNLVCPIILSNCITHWQMNTWPPDILVCYL